MDRTDGGAVGGTAASLSDNVEMLSMSNHNEEEEEEEDAETDGEDEEDEADYEEDGEFRWSIDDLAQLMPVDIEVKNKKLSRPLPSALSPFLFVHLLIGGGGEAACIYPSSGRQPPRLTFLSTQHPF